MSKQKHILIVIAAALCVAQFSSPSTSSAADKSRVKFRTLKNPEKDIVVVSDRDEKWTEFFQRQRLVIGQLEAKELSARFEAKEPSEKLFLNFASYNHGPGGRAFSTFGQDIRIAPVPKTVADVLTEVVKRDSPVPVILRRGDAESNDPPDGRKEPPIWDVVGYTTKSEVRMFEPVGQKPERFDPKGLLYVAKADDGAALNVKADGVAREEHSESLIGYSSTRIFYTLADRHVVVTIVIDNKQKDFPATGVVHQFGADASKEAIAKWVNNQHSDALFADAAEPVATHKIPPKALSIKGTKQPGQVQAGTGTWEKYSVKFGVGDSELDAKMRVKEFEDSATVYVPLK